MLDLLCLALHAKDAIELLLLLLSLLDEAALLLKLLRLTSLVERLENRGLALGGELLLLAPLALGLLGRTLGAQSVELTERRDRDTTKSVR